MFFDGRARHQLSSDRVATEMQGYLMVEYHHHPGVEADRVVYFHTLPKVLEYMKKHSNIQQAVRSGVIGVHPIGPALVPEELLSECAE